MGTVIGTFILLALVAAIGWGAYKLVQRRKAWNALSPAEQQHQRAITEADKAVRTAKKEYDKSVKGTRKELERARTPQKLGRFKTEHVGGWQDAFKGEREFVLHDDRIKTPSGEHRLTSNVSAVVDTAGNLAHKSRSTVTRMGAGAVIAGPLGLLVGAAVKKGKTVDSRELFLMVEGEDWADTTNCDPAKEGEKVRKFAQAVNLAARNVDRVKAEREQRVRDLTKRLAAVESDRSGIEAAERHRAALEHGAVVPPGLAPAPPDAPTA
jgi:hypothetical protein